MPTLFGRNMSFARLTALFLTVAIPGSAYAQQVKRVTPPPKIIRGTVVEIDGTGSARSIVIESGGKMYFVLAGRISGESKENPVIEGVILKVTYNRTALVGNVLVLNPTRIVLVASPPEISVVKNPTISSRTLAPNLTVGLGKSTNLELALIRSGSFMMGSDKSDREKPVHQVTISKPFYLGKYEVTQVQWQAVMGKNPSYFPNCGVDCPVENVSWNMAQEFIKRLNARHDGNTYRLPTEAEWEYAARAGTAGDYAGNVDEIAWYANNAGDQTLDADKLFTIDPDPNAYAKRVINNGNRTHPVGTKKPNEWGLYDMSGNVLEWCHDWADGGYYGKSPSTDPKGPAIGIAKVMRGGSWGSYAANVRSAFRNLDSPDSFYGDYGFRIVAVPSVK